MTTRLSTQHDSQFSSSPPSPSPSLDYSIVSHPSPSPDRDATLYASHPARSQPYLCSTRYSASSSRDRDKRTNVLHGSSSPYHLATGGNRAPQTGKSMKFLLPRLWGALSSPTRKARRQTARRKPYTLPSNISYADLQPLDGEEGELIDEACYVERYDSTQSPRKLIGPRLHSLSPRVVPEISHAFAPTDFLSYLPPEIAVYLLCFLDLSSVIACQSVSRAWNMIANDNAVWRELFFRRQGWGINLDRAIARGWTPPILEGLPESPTSFVIPDCPWSHTPKNSTYSERTSSSLGLSIDPRDVRAHSLVHIPSFRDVSSPWSPELSNDAHHPLTTSMNVPLSLPWRELYKKRYTLDARWTSSAPQTKYLTGHADSVYCLEFDSKRIITGSRDRSIKVWDIQTGRCLGTFRGHYGSVLCLKFEKDWDIKGDGKKGFMVSGSSDRRACVWDIWIGEGGEVCAEVRAVLKGHLDGVLDLRVDEQWIVSW